MLKTTSLRHQLVAGKIPRLGTRALGRELKKVVLRVVVTLLCVSLLVYLLGI